MLNKSWRRRPQVSLLPPLFSSLLKHKSRLVDKAFNLLRLFLLPSSIPSPLSLQFPSIVSIVEHHNVHCSVNSTFNDSTTPSTRVQNAFSRLLTSPIIYKYLHAINIFNVQVNLSYWRKQFACSPVLNTLRAILTAFNLKQAT